MIGDAIILWAIGIAFTVALFLRHRAGKGNWFTNATFWWWK